MILHLNEMSVSQKQNWLQHAIAPRPIGLVSTIDHNGLVNLAPFSFFNLFSTEPPIVIFSPARRVRDNTIKHTLANLQQVPQAVVHIVTCNMVQQVSLASCDYAAGENEFIKAGFSAVPATIVKPPMVKESPVKMECKVLEIKPLGENGGAGNLIIAEVLCMHVDEAVLTKDKGMIDPLLLQQVARLGGNWYCKVTAANMFEVEKPNTKNGIGIDALPDAIRLSEVFTGNHLAQLASVSVIPSAQNNNQKNSDVLNQTIDTKNEIHTKAISLLNKNEISEAWQLLLPDQ